jgi:hypothetical protein
MLYTLKAMQRQTSVSYSQETRCTWGLASDSHLCLTGADW